MSRPLWAIAQDIYQDWGVNVSRSARPYLEAMSELETVNDMYYADSARSVVLYALANMGSYRGETARKLKAELKQLLKEGV